jgi:hypothetical protein
MKYRWQQIKGACAWRGIAPPMGRFKASRTTNIVPQKNWRGGCPLGTAADGRRYRSGFGQERRSAATDAHQDEGGMQGRGLGLQLLCRLAVHDRRRDYMTLIGYVRSTMYLGGALPYTLRRQDVDTLLATIDITHARLAEAPRSDQSSVRWPDTQVPTDSVIAVVSGRRSRRQGNRRPARQRRAI